MRDTVLVTGGAGYIGSHIVLAFLDEGYEVVVIDDLSNGFHELLPDTVVFTQGDFGDEEQMEQVFSRVNIGMVIHAAASISVPESVVKPLWYYENNVIKTVHLIRCCMRHHIRAFIFSSSSAVYGTHDGPIKEVHAVTPISPYGSSKLMVECILRDLAKAKGFCSVSLRYFNVAGADPKLRAGDMKNSSGGLVKGALQCATGKSATMDIYGTDYQTADGTAVRDYIHVCDVARANLCAAKYAERRQDSSIFNVGSGKGSSVREIVSAVERVAGVTITTNNKARRPGDPVYVVADTGCVHKALHFSPMYEGLDRIISDAFAWERCERNKSDTG